MALHSKDFWRMMKSIQPDRELTEMLWREKWEIQMWQIWCITITFIKVYYCISTINDWRSVKKVILHSRPLSRREQKKKMKAICLTCRNGSECECMKSCGRFSIMLRKKNLSSQFPYTSVEFTWDYWFFFIF